MKKNVLRITTVLAAAAVILVMLLAFAKSDAHAASYEYDLTPYEGQAAYAWFSTSYESGTLAYYKIKPSKTGIITFTADYSGYAALCNSAGKVISYGYSADGDYIYSSSTKGLDKSIWFGVKKGRTYYVRMSGYPSNRDSSNTYYATVKWSTSKVAAAKSGTKKSKAKTIKRKKTIKGLFVAGDKKAKWYKITNKQKVTKITFASSKNNYGLKFKLYYKSFNKWYSNIYTLGRGKLYQKDIVKATVSKKVKHTYYIKVYRDGKTSGYYTLKWK